MIRAKTPAAIILLFLTIGLLIPVAGCDTTPDVISFIFVSPSISPSPGNYLTNSRNESSKVLLMDIDVSQGISNKKYDFPSKSPVTVGDSILIVSGRIRNEHQQNKEIALYAEGYDENGKQVSWTLDTAHIIGQIGLHLEYYQFGYFVLHLNMVENIKSIRVFGSNYEQVPP